MRWIVAAIAVIALYAVSKARGASRQTVTVDSDLHSDAETAEAFGDSLARIVETRSSNPFPGDLSDGVDYHEMVEVTKWGYAQGILPSPSVSGFGGGQYALNVGPEAYPEGLPRFFSGEEIVRYVGGEAGAI